MEAQKPLRILALDAGWFYDRASLSILEYLLAYVERHLCPQNPGQTAGMVRPCDIFDLICGCGSGGLIALMLGRLGLV